MQVADLDFQTRSLRGGLWETCKSGPIRPAPTPTRDDMHGQELLIVLISITTYNIAEVNFFIN